MPSSGIRNDACDLALNRFRTRRARGVRIDISQMGRQLNGFIHNKVPKRSRSVTWHSPVINQECRCTRGSPCIDSSRRQHDAAAGRWDSRLSMILVRIARSQMSGMLLGMTNVWRLIAAPDPRGDIGITVMAFRRLTATVVQEVRSTPACQIKRGRYASNGCFHRAGVIRASSK